ncbi:MAG: TrkH family potassium uptake protein [Gammaproteobacteria bacterium]|nr:TrkH family potassium uptake protein [Gammaproteobacteria bacterium]
MHLLPVQRVLGILLMLFSLTMLAPAAVDLWYRENSAQPFTVSFAAILAAGLLAWLPARRCRAPLNLKEAFLIVVLSWAILCAAAALPFYLLPHPGLALHDAVFEAVSGLTTTGATVLQNLDSLPRAVLFYRQFLQWLGGLGIIVIAIAIAPVLGIGGMQLYRTDLLSTARDTKLMPRIGDTARGLLNIYLLLTALCALAYWLAGMSVFDSVAHGFSTMAIGGFSTHDANLGYFAEQPAVLVVAMVFMLIAGMNFSLHFIAWRRRSLLAYWKDTEWTVFLSVVGVIALATVAYLLAVGNYDDAGDSVLLGAFHAVSITTTTGFTAAPHHAWPGFVPMLLLLASFIGGCAGSTGGGMKVIRFWLLLKQGLGEMAQLVHPDAKIPVKVNHKALDVKVVQAVWGFFSAYVGSLIIIYLLLMGAGLDQETAFSAAAAAINNLGPGLGEVAQHYTGLNAFCKWVLSFSMLLGRLEVFALLIVFTPMFWRK